MPVQQDLSLLQRLAYLQAGGKDQGQSTLDKLNQTFNTIGQTGKTVMDYAREIDAMDKAKLERARLQAEVPHIQSETDKLRLENEIAQRGQTPYRFIAPSGQSPQQTQSLTNQVMQTPIPVNELIKGEQYPNQFINPETGKQTSELYSASNLKPSEFIKNQPLTQLSNTQKGLDQIKNKIINSQNQYGDLTQKEYASDAAAQYRQAQYELEKKKAEDYGKESMVPEYLQTPQGFEATGKMVPKNRAVVNETQNATLGLRENQQQDRLEQQARQSVSQLRGDKSLSRVEEQRDAAIVAYNRIKEIQDTGSQLNPIDYTDILGQIYKARTGAAPTERVLEEIRQDTAQGKFAKAYTYITGQQAPATTQDITNSLLNMASSMGAQADKFHAAYMKSHLIKPSGLDSERWNGIVSTDRGLSFSEATGLKESPKSNNNQYATLGALQMAFKAGKISSDEAKKYAISKGWAK